MKQDQALLEAIRATPEDDVPRLIYADWLDDHDLPERADLIRAQCALAKLPEWEPERVDLEPRAQALLEKHGKAWAAHLPTWARRTAPTFRRGFIAEVCVSAGEFVRYGAGLHRLAPIEVLGLRRAGEYAAELAAAPHLRHFRSLDLGPSQSAPLLDAAGLRALLASPHLSPLTSLTLSGGDPEPVVGALATAPVLANLTRLHLGIPLGPEGAEVLAASPVLTHLTEFRARLGAEGIEAFARSAFLGRLQRLDLRYAYFGPEGGGALAKANLASLVELKLGDNHLGAAGAQALATAPHLPLLADLCLAGNQIGDVGMATLASAPWAVHLKRLDLFFNQITAVGARALAAAPHLAGLTWLGLGSNEIADEGARALALSPYLANLAYLSLDNSGIGDEGALALAASPSLRRLRRLDVHYADALGEEGRAALRAAFGERVHLCEA